MGRPHIEFFQSQLLPWEAAAGGGYHQGVEIKTLSRDDQSGACSLLLRYPPGWGQEGQRYIDVDEELIVLGGALEINAVEYSDQCYAHLPAGFERRQASSPEGATVLTFLSGTPESVDGAAATAIYDEARLVERIDTFSAARSTDVTELGVKLTDEIADGFYGFVHLLYREDPYTHDQTWMLAAPPLWRGGVVEIHPVVEEMYLVAGDMAANTGLMKPGAYFWRPPGIPHGPFGSKTGNLMFFRTLGGPLATEFEPGEEHFSWSPEHRPVLPPALRQYAGQPAQESRCY